MATHTISARGSAVRARWAAATVVAMLFGALGAPTPAGASGLTGYVTMPDGVRIAVAINFPTGASAIDGNRYPTVFIMDGYGTGGVNPAEHGDGFVTVRASVRGTGCSGGEFGLFDRQQVEDGRYVIENWLVNQPWSNQRVGIYGHSYAGLVGFLIAATNPPHVEAASLGGVFDDLYRSIIYPGGIPNRGFPALWMAAIRPGSEAVNYSALAIQGDTDRDVVQWPDCAANIATRSYSTDQTLHRFLTASTDDAYYAVRSLRTYAPDLRVPTHLFQQYQDEQTGPRGAEVLFELIPDGVPKRLRMTNGPHAATSPMGEGFNWTDTTRWFDCFLKDDCRGDIADPERRVQLHFETLWGSEQPFEIRDAYASSDWPLPETDWRRAYLRADGSMTLDAPEIDEPAIVYESLPQGRQTAAQLAGFQSETGVVAFTDGPDLASFRLSFPQQTTIAGPMLASLNISTDATDTDLFVDILDRAPDGSLEYLQRGVLRASHRKVDASRSDRIDSGPYAGEVYRPWRPHTAPEPVTPGKIERYDIEVFALGHVFRAGHSLILQVHAPPPIDPLSTWAWESGRGSRNTIHLNASYPSSLLFPVLPATPPLSPEAPRCGQQAGIPCLGNHG